MSGPGPLADTFVIAGCSRSKASTSLPLPALELYQGGIAPALCARLAGHDELLGRVMFLSARHGLIGASQPLLPYDHVLTEERARALRPQVHTVLRRRLDGRSGQALLLVTAEPAYLSLMADVLADPDRPRIRWITDPRGWDDTAAVLDEWNWP
ncbi:hypothetical protein [Streptomyces nojiriensis]|uniref:hypothetical protein n=1 Tax=Streptomyces nojiriensis TaxID=66374 RepID=UPI0035E13609